MTSGTEGTSDGGELTPEEQVLAEAESIAENAEEEVVLEGLVEVERIAAERLDELQRSKAAYYNLEQQYSGFVKRSKADALAAHAVSYTHLTLPTILLV